MGERYRSAESSVLRDHCSAAITLVLGILGGVANDVLFGGIVRLPIAIGIGILKYRLYEIDRVAVTSLDLHFSRL